MYAIDFKFIKKINNTFIKCVCITAPKTIAISATYNNLRSSFVKNLAFILYLLSFMIKLFINSLTM